MIYLDSAATTYPKPQNVYASVSDALRRYSFNSGRGGYRQSVDAAEKIFDVRIKLAEMFNCSEQNIAFTNNCTTAVNTAVRGLAKKGSHILISSLEHNAVWRTVCCLREDGISDFDIVEYSSDTEKFLNNIKEKERSNTSMVVMLHASNVFGVVTPIKAIGDYCRQKGWYYIVDAAQSAGVLPIDMKDCGISVLCAPGHKGLYGIMGSGFLALSDSILPAPLTCGGTGSNSADWRQPDDLPDRLEAGTLNNPGIISIGAGVDFINRKGIDTIYHHEMRLIEFMYKELEKTEGISLYAPFEQIKAPVLSFNVGDYHSEEAASRLAERQIAVRAGLHCAPLAHNSFKTSNRGSVRVSPCAFTTFHDCEYFLNSVKNM